MANGVHRRKWEKYKTDKRQQELKNKLSKQVNILVLGCYILLYRFFWCSLYSRSFVNLLYTTTYFTL